MTRPTRSPQAGHTLLVALVVLVATSSAALLVVATLLLRMQEVDDEARALRLEALADAAVAETLAGLASSSAFRGLPETPFGGGQIGSELTVRNGPSRTYRIQARYAGRVQRVEIDILVSAITGLRVTRWKRLPAHGHQDDPAPDG